MTNATKIAYMEASPKLTGKARQYGRGYRRMALVEIPADCQTRPAMISERCADVIRIIEDRTENIGSTDRSFGKRCRDEMQAKADVIFG